MPIYTEIDSICLQSQDFRVWCHSGSLPHSFCSIIFCRHCELL